MVLMLVLPIVSIAQKKKKQKEDDNHQELITSLSKDDLMQAEYFFVEGEKYFILDKYAKAVEFFKESLKFNPSNAGSNFKIAQSLYELEDNEQALVYALKAKNLNPENKYYYILLADIYTQVSNYKEAALVYEELLENVPGTENQLFQLAALYYYLKNYPKALETYNRAEERYGLVEEIAYQKQDIYSKQGKHELAIQEIKRLSDEYPNEMGYKLDLIRLYIDNNMEEEAVAALEEILTEDPSNAQASVMISEIYRKQGNEQQAMEALKVAFENPSLNFQAKLQLLAGYMAQLPDSNIEGIAIELSDKITTAHPEESRGFALAGDLHYQLGNKERATKNYRQAVALDKSNFSLWQNIIQIETELAQYEQVISHSEEALEYFPNQAVLYYFNGSAHLIQKDYKRAIRSFDQGKKYASNNELKSVFYSQLGDAYNGNEENQKSDDSYEKAIELDPKNDHALNNYSYYLSLRKQKLERAVEMSTKLVERHPNNSTYLDTHAWVLYMLGDFKQALVFLEKAIEDDSASGTIIEHLGDVLFKLGKKDEALVKWKLAKEQGGASDLIDKKIADQKLYEE